MAVGCDNTQRAARSTAVAVDTRHKRSVRLFDAQHPAGGCMGGEEDAAARQAQDRQIPQEADQGAHTRRGTAHRPVEPPLHPTPDRT